MKNKITIMTMALCLLFPCAASAHTLWVNLYESHAHNTGHVLASLGWGHVVPMDDVFDHFNLASYSLYDPAKKKTALSLPVPGKDLTGKDSKMKIATGDMGVHKITTGDNAMKGTYQVVAVSKENFYSTYINKAGRKTWSHTTMDKVKDAKKVLEGMKFVTYAKSFFTVDKWTQPQPLGFDLEIIPKTDLSDVHAGELVEFSISLMGKPLNTNPVQSFEYMTLTSNTFGGPDGFMLAAVVFNGKAVFRVPTAGQWVANVYTRQVVTPDGLLKSLVGKCTSAVYAGTVNFNVKP